MNKVKKEMLDRWKIDDSADLYGIRSWGAGYFDIARNGDVVVTPFPDKKVSVSIKEIINGALERDWICRCCSHRESSGRPDRTSAQELPQRH